MNIDPNSQAFPNEEGARGITKREYFIAAALQGLCATMNIHDRDEHPPSTSFDWVMAGKTAIWIADITIKALNEEQ